MKAIVTRALAALVLVSATQAAQPTPVAAADRRVTRTPEQETSAALSASGRLVAFTRERADGGREVLYRWLDASGPVGREAAVGAPGTEDRLAGVLGGGVVFASRRAGSLGPEELRIVDTDTGAVRTLARQVLAAAVDRGGSGLAWVEATARRPRIVVMEVGPERTGAPRVVARPDGPVADLAIGERYVVWTERRNGTADVVGYDRRNGSALTIAGDGARDESAPSTHGAWVAWQSDADGQPGSRIEALNLETGERRTVADDGAHNRRPVMAADVIAYDSDRAGNVDVYAYRLSTTDTAAVTSDPADQRLLDLAGNQVAYSDARDGQLDVFVGAVPFADVGAQDADAGDVDAQGGRTAASGAANVGEDFQTAAATFNWSERGLLAGNRAQDRFGTAVALDGDVAVVGVPRDTGGGTFGGSAYVYVWNGTTWVEQARLSTTLPFDEFGASVDVSGETIVVGAPGANTAGGPDTGAVHVYTRTGTRWTRRATLLASDPGANDGFGEAVAIDGTTVVVGAPRWDGGFATGLDDTGAAYVFRFDGTNWVADGRLTLPSATTGGPARAGDLMGTAVDVSGGGGTILVGAPHAGSVTGSGMAYIFLRGTGGWFDQARLSGPAQQNASFGASVSMSGDRAAIGAPFYDQSPEFADCGSVFVYTRSGSSWPRVEVQGPCDPFSPDRFGSSVAISGTGLIGGSPRDDREGVSSGNAWIFSLANGVWQREHELTGSQRAAGHEFGNAVAMDGGRVLVGAWRAEHAGAAMAGATYAYSWGAIRFTEDAFLTGSEGSAGERMGRIVGVSDFWAVVGAWGDDDAGPSTGAAYVFWRNGINWGEQYKLLADDLSPGDEFGLAVAIDADTIVVGAPRHDANGHDAGAAYVFTRSHNGTGWLWTQQARLLPSDGQADDFFGIAVAVSGNTIAVGARAEDSAGLDAGAVYVFTRTGIAWTQQAKLMGAATAAGDQFGSALALAGDRLVVGAPGHDAGASGTGAAHVFERAAGAWTEAARLLASDRGASHALGQSVAIGEALVVAGAPGANGTAGAAYAFRQQGGTWSQFARAVAADGLANDRLGFSVATRGNLVLAGAPSAGGRGALYAFAARTSGVTLLGKIVTPNGQDGEEFGFSVATDGDDTLVGAPGRTIVGALAGAGHALQLQYAVPAPGVEAGPAVTLDEGSFLGGLVSFVDAADQGPWTVTVDYGDGTPPGSLTLTDITRRVGLSHRYLDGPATRTVTVSITSADLAEDTDTFLVTVRNVAPAVAVSGFPAIGEGGAFLYEFAVSDPGADGFTITSHACGSAGSVVAGSLSTTEAGGQFRCLFPDGPAASTVAVSVRDDDGAAGTDTLDVNVVNAQPHVVAGGDAELLEGAALDRLGSFLDAGADTWTATVDYGLGAGAQPLPLAGRDFRLLQRYLDEGAHLVRVEVTDSDGAKGTATFAVRVSNVAPAVTLLGMATFGQPFAVADVPLEVTADFVDPGEADTHNASAVWGDGSTQPPRPASHPFQATHTYAAAGTYPLALTVADGDGGQGTATAQVIVLDPAGVVTRVLDQIKAIVAGPPIDAEALTALRAALRALEGRNGGAGTGGALDRLLAGALPGALRQLSEAVAQLDRAQAADPSLALAPQRAALALAAKSVAGDRLEAAGAAADTTFERNKVAQARTEMAAGDAAFAAGDYAAAIGAYRRSFAAARWVR
jgi:hypothetical protein